MLNVVYHNRCTGKMVSLAHFHIDGMFIISVVVHHQPQFDQCKCFSHAEHNTHTSICYKNQHKRNKPKIKIIREEE